MIQNYCPLAVYYIVYYIYYIILYITKYNIHNNSQVKPAIIMILPVFLQENTVVVS